MISAWKWRHLNGFGSVMVDPLLLFSPDFTRSAYFLQHNRLLLHILAEMTFRLRPTILHKVACLFVAMWMKGYLSATRAFLSEHFSHNPNVAIPRTIRHRVSVRIV